MKTWLGVLCMLVVIGSFANPAFGGGVDNKQNFSAAYAGSLSRNAATDGTDVAAYNPGGLMFLNDGFTMSVDAQPFTFDYDHTFDGETRTASPWLVTPTAFGVYKSDKWAVFGAFTINGGGGETEYDNGNIITENIGNAAAAGRFTNTFYTYWEGVTGTTRPNNNQLGTNGTLSNEYAYAKSFDYTFTTGLSYKFNSVVSVAAGVRYVWTDKEVDIHGTYTASGISTDVLGKYDQEADGFGGIFGVNLHPSDTVNIGIRYETKVKLDWDTTVDSATRGTVGENILWINGRVHGESYARDLPAVLGLGIEWQVLPKLSINPSYTHYFEKDADWDSQNSKTDKNSYDLALGLQYDINEQWSATAGYMYIGIGLTPDDYGIIEQMSPPLDCHAFALGAKYRMTKQLMFTFGLTGYFYQADTDFSNTPVVTYDKELYSGAIGIQYSFM